MKENTSKNVAAVLDKILSHANGEPKSYTNLISASLTLGDIDKEISQHDVIAALESEEWGGPVHSVIKKYLAEWDYENHKDWIKDTPPNTQNRRDLIYQILDIGQELVEALNMQTPFYSGEDEIIVVSEKFEHFWYSSERQKECSYYWDEYFNYLRIERGWEEDSLRQLERSSVSIVERLSDPRRQEIYQSKGLVVGYVQSGKTANITGVVARAADAGYRLIIILSGRTNLLRDQTQYRIDKELIGKEFIRRDSDGDDEDVDYQQLPEDEWQAFIEHGMKPSAKGIFDWVRLTGENSDYKRLKAGIETLEFEKRDEGKPFNHVYNLSHAKAKIAVIKKDKGIILKVAKDLRRISSKLSEVPVLVIDDESDEASINTINPTTLTEKRKRTQTNNAIVELLQQLPRSQYIGYTATPFANVLIDPDDAMDLFPKDFVISLDRPIGYMGAKDFHDLEELPEEEQKTYKSNRFTYVRDIEGEDLSADKPDENLVKAIDSYMLAGALKLYREMKGFKFKHHTMLIHHAVQKSVHESVADSVKKALGSAGYLSGDGLRRLKVLYEEDFKPLSKARFPELPLPKNFNSLKKYIGQMWSKLNTGDPVLIVNGSEMGQDPDFNKRPVWKILVGGTKLSRGYTVEGLTISYFRRKTGAGDTLMQMGRWFGFRRGYQDLVRLFVGSPVIGKSNRNYDVYSAFEIICRDEEAFREQIRRYAMPEDGSEPITPRQIPLVLKAHARWLLPTSRNKRFNSEVKYVNLKSSWSDPTMAPTSKSGIEHNIETFKKMLNTSVFYRAKLGIGEKEADCLCGVVSNADMITCLERYKWSDDNESKLSNELAYLKGRGDYDPCIDQWIVIAPLLQSYDEDNYRIFKVGDTRFSIRYRASTQTGRVKVYTEPFHKVLAEFITGKIKLNEGNENLKKLKKSKTGVMLFYPSVHDKDKEAYKLPTMGFSLLFPDNRIKETLVIAPVDKKKTDYITIDKV